MNAPAPWRMRDHSAPIRVPSVQTYTAAGLAQLVEHLICNQGVTSSSLVAGTTFPLHIQCLEDRKTVARKSPYTGKHWVSISTSSSSPQTRSRRYFVPFLLVKGNSTVQSDQHCHCGAESTMCSGLASVPYCPRLSFIWLVSSRVPSHTRSISTPLRLGYALMLDRTVLDSWVARWFGERGRWPTGSAAVLALPNKHHITTLVQTGTAPSHKQLTQCDGNAAIGSVL